MNMISTGAFQTEMDASSKEETLVTKLVSAWEKKNAKVARAGGVSLMALSLAACGSSDSSDDSGSADSSSDTSSVSTTPVNLSMTTSADSLVGDSGADTFTGLLSGAMAAGSTAQAGDSVTGGGGSDTFTLYVSGDAGAAYNLGGIITAGVETIGVSNYDADAGATTLDMQAMTGVTNVSLSNSSATGDTVFSNVQNMVDGYAKGAGDMTITYAASVVTGTADVQDVTVDTYTGKLTTASVETLNLTASGGNSTLTDISATSATKVTVAGDKNLTITADVATGLAAAKEINASDMTGKLTLTSSDTTLATFVGGSGNDTLVRNIQNSDAAATDSFDGGAGTDTLSVTTGANISSANMAKYSNFETLKITGAHGASVDLTDVSMFTHVVNANATNGTTTITGVQAGTTFGLTTSNDTSDSVTIDLQNENNAGDETTITFGTTAAGVTLGTVTASDFETLNLVTQGGASSVNSLVDADLTTLNVSGAKNLTITAATAANLATIDASAMTGNFIMGAAMGKTTVAITTGSGADTVYAGTGTSTIDTGAGNDTITGSAAASLGGTKTIKAGAGNDSIEVNDFSDLTSADTIDGGDGTDTLKFSEDADHNFTTDISQLNGVSNIEQYSFSGFNGGARTVTINDTIMNNGAIKLIITSDVTANITNVVNASGVLNSSNTVTLTDNSATAANTTYSVGNGIDIVSLGALADTVNVTNYAFLSSSDTIAGGTGSDTINIDINGGGSASARVTISDQLNGLSGFENINIDDDAATYIGLTLTDTIVNANQANNALTIAMKDSGGTATTALGMVDASGVTATVALDITGGGAVDTLKGGAGSDTLEGGNGIDVIDLSAGGADDVTLTSSAAANADKITGFTLAGTGATAVSGTDQIVFQADPTSNDADLFDAGNVVLAATDPTTTAGTIVNITATDYAEAAGGGTAAGEDNHVVVITGVGYASANACLDGNGGTNSESVIITFYNTSTQRAEIHHAADADGDTTTLLAYFTDIGLADMSSFSAANFAVESLG